MEQHDQVGRASARLLANGVSGPDRLDALHLLGILDASADVAGRVRRPLDDLAAEFALDPADVLRSLDHLEDADAIRRHGGTLVIVDRDEGGAGGLLLSDFIEDLRAVLDDAVPPVPSRWRVRAGAALVAAAAVVGVVSLAPSRPGPAPSVAVGDAPDRVGQSGPTSSIPRRAGTVTSATSATAPGTVPVPGAGASPGVDSAAVAAGCPDEEPVVEVVGAAIEVTNPSTVDIVVNRLAVDGAPLPVTRFVVPAGTTVTPSVVVPAADDDVTILDWEWDDPIIGDRCG